MSGDPTAKKPSNYLQYLPDVYARKDKQAPPEGGGFLGQYLNVFEKVLSGLDDQQLDRHKGIGQALEPDFIAGLFDPRLSFLFPDDSKTPIPPMGPPGHDEAFLKRLQEYIYLAASEQSQMTALRDWLRDFLKWYASWLSFLLPTDWGLDKQRTLLSQLLSIYRARGTQHGIQRLLDLSIARKGDAPFDAIEVLEQSPQTPRQVSQRVPIQVGKNTLVQDAYQPGYPIVGGQLPWCFWVKVTLNQSVAFSIEHIEHGIRQLRALLDRMKPAFSRYHLEITPSFHLQSEGRPDHTASLGVNTLLAWPPENAPVGPTIRLSRRDHQLGINTLLGPAPLHIPKTHT